MGDEGGGQWLNGWRDEAWVGGRVEGWKDGRANERMGEGTGGWTDGGLDRRVSGGVDGRASK